MAERRDAYPARADELSDRGTDPHGGDQRDAVRPVDRERREDSPVPERAPATEPPSSAPGVQVTTGGTDDEGRPWARDVSNAVPGQPDGEVDTRPRQPATGSDTP
ncbi:hypothetical protein [Allonocardiopsis opalescens]|uniref:Uncharacterized protein n=1 Tax=Allonocardiopsis opalescens TaxID=1144618 RepID=A0A2T0PVQ8_9ACTN|nr:hypothetical protein [Allonocardiopsis opalescens]PRX95619.1 hypothetical protein CLV72_109228 [Allonocardiopsis opalescens]